MAPLLLDTSFVLALEADGDVRRETALARWEEILALEAPLVTTSCVVVETVTFLSSRGLHAKAVDVGASLMHSPFMECVFVNRDLFEEGWAFFQRHRDKTFSLTDCVSFVLMKRRRITTALTFDKHFAQAGFTMLP
jgi:hypothetical protein